MAVEFALTITIFISVLLAIIDFSRWMYAIDAAAEATRTGARVAAVCDKNSPAIDQRMGPSVATSSGGSITKTYFPSNTCVASSVGAAVGSVICTGVSVTTSGYSVPRVAWFLPTMTVPTMTTYLSRESMTSTDNARCS